MLYTADVRRILLLITDLQIGGTPTVVRELALRLTRAGGARVDVACLAPWGPVAEQLAAAGIRVTALGATGMASLPGVARRLRRLLAGRQIQTVLSFLIHANAVAALIGTSCPGVRFLQSIQTTQPWPRWHWKLQGIVARAAERIIVPSLSVADAARRASGIPATKIAIVSNAVDVGDFAMNDSVGRVPGARDRQVNATDAVAAICHIGFIGRLDPIKRVPDLLTAMTLLGPTVHLDIYGEGAERPRLEQLISSLRLSDRVTLHGAIARPQDALGRIDVLVLPSQAEGFGLVLIEAMAAGVAVVGTNVPGIRDVVRAGQTGLLVRVSAPDELAGAIRRLLDEPGYREELIQRARSDVAARYSWSAVLPMYQRLLGVI